MFVASLIVLDNSGLVVYGLLCAAVHELGHLAVIKACKAPVGEISLRLFGIRIRMRANTRLSYRQELCIALAGSMANLALAAGAYGLFRAGVCPRQAGAVALFSLIIGGFNLLPMAALDGGTALEAALCTRIRPERASMVINILSFCLIVPLGAAGLVLMLETRFNFSLLLVAVYLAAMLVFKERKKSPAPRLR